MANNMSQDRLFNLRRLIRSGKSRSYIVKEEGYDWDTVSKYANLWGLPLHMPHTLSTAEEREAAVKLCERVGVVKAAEQLGISAKKLYLWRSKAKGSNRPKAPNKAPTKKAGMYKVGSELFNSKEDAIRHCVKLAGGITLVTESKVEV